MRLPIRLRLTLSFALGMVVIVLGLGAFLYIRLGSGLLDSIDVALKSRAEVIVAGIDPQNVNFGDEPGSIVSPTDAFAQVLDRSANVLESTDAVAGGPLLPPSILRGITGPTFFDRAVPGLARAGRLLVLPTGDRPQRLYVVVGSSLAGREAALDGLLTLLVIGGPVVVLLTSLAAWALASAALRPVDRMRREAAEISTSPDRRLQVPATGDEVARLAETLNAMLDRLEEAFGRERRFVDDASHELRTPLGILRGELELARARPRTLEELTDALGRASEETDHLSRLADDLLVLSRANRGRLPVHREEVDLAELIEHAARPFRVRATEAGATLAVHAAPGLARIDPVRLRQAVGNLLDNALRHVPSGGQVRLRVDRREGAIRIRVEDSGPGFPEDFLERAFEPFARADRDTDGDGAGLGLAIVRAVAEAHGGSARVENLPGGGAAVTATLEDQGRPDP